LTIQPTCLPYFPYHFTIQLAFFPYFPYLFTFQLTFLPYFPSHFTFHPYFSYLFTMFCCIVQITLLFDLTFFHFFKIISVFVSIFSLYVQTATI
jgi:hypothetical protein